MENENNIATFFDNKTILVTGVTGFVGKVLLEKLLRCCPGIKQVYLLIRPKKGKAIKDRLNDMFAEELFQKLRYNQPCFRDKVTPVEGDLLKHRLGLSTDARAMLTGNTEIVIHSAATVKFDEILRVALQMNVRAVREIIQLCKEMKKIQVLCHVSTAYSNCDKDEIEERIYPVETSPQKLLDVAEWMSDESLKKITPSLLSRFPNTYTFTKGLAEELIKDELQDIPCCIVRPAIVTAIYKDPLPGWTDNLNGPNGLILAVGKGFIRTLRCGKRCVSPLVPVDYVANSIIVATFTTAIQRPADITVYNCTVNPSNSVTWEDFGLEGVKVMRQYPFEDIFRRPNFSFSSSPIAHIYWRYVSHRIPAVVADTLCIFTGSKPKIWRLYGKVERAISVIEPFISKEWTWRLNNLSKAYHTLSPSDREVFYCNMKDISWEEYMPIYILGVKRFLGKDDMSDLTKARRQALKSRIIRWISYIVFCMISWRLLMFKSPRFRQLWFRMLSCCYHALKSVNLVSLR